MNERVLLEVCVDSIVSAVEAEAGGADRIEVCADRDHGGVTPSAGLIAAVKEAVRIPVMVLIRPRAGSFTYSKDEFDVIQRDIRFAVSAGVNGIVCGALLPDHSIDVARTREMVSAAGQVPVTFHRSIDETPEPVAAARALLDCGIQRILTSGGRPTAHEGVETIREMTALCGDRISVIAASGISGMNVQRIIRATGVREVHAGASVSSIARSGSLLFGTTIRQADRTLVRELRIALASSLTGMEAGRE